MMVDSVFVNSGRGCINCSGIWASRHTREIAERHRAAARGDSAAAARASRREPGRLHRAGRRRRDLAVDRRRPARRRASTDVTAKHRDGDARLDQAGTRRLPAADGDSLRLAGAAAVAKKEYMFPFVTVVECPEAKMLDAIGPTLVCTRDHLQRRPSGGGCSTRCTSTG